MKNLREASEKFSIINGDAQMKMQKLPSETKKDASGTLLSSLVSTMSFVQSQIESIVSESNQVNSEEIESVMQQLIPELISYRELSVRFNNCLEGLINFRTQQSKLDDQQKTALEFLQRMISDETVYLGSMMCLNRVS